MEDAEEEEEEQRNHEECERIDEDQLEEASIRCWISFFRRHQEISKSLTERSVFFFFFLFNRSNRFIDMNTLYSEYRNPDFLLHAVSYQDIDHTASCFCIHVFDPTGYDPIDFCDALEVDMKNERERKEQESKMNQMLDLVSAGAHPGMVLAPQKPNIPIPGVPPLATSGLPSVPTEIAAHDVRHNKKSKWDKVDGDVKNPPALAAETNAALVSAGSGYSAFV
ncbi:hypothetical protein Bca4012_056286 [Brassica carinata]|uniref:Uncharacterized protein n=1 Tax=Brassica carinata TaxID=52824 RepID=A0A8X7W074_BRACI|nr:hypothetical protein Bca52824_013894 [Brassica carinata]